MRALGAVGAGLSLVALLLLGACGGSRAERAELGGEVATGEATTPVRTGGANVVESVEPWTFGGAEGQIIRTRHYRIYTTETNAVLVNRLPGFLEAALDHYRNALGPLPPPPIRLDTFLMDNRSQWTRLTTQLMGRDAPRFLRIGRGGFATNGRAVLYDIGLFDTMAIAAHEGWHQYTQRTFRDPLPVYLEEGIASYMEGHKWAGSTPVFLPWANVERFDQLRAAAARDELQPLRTLLDSAPQDLLDHVGDGALTYYAQVWALVHFLHEGAGGRHRETLRNLLIDASQGRMRNVLVNRYGTNPGMTALASRRGAAVFVAYFDDLEAIEAEFERFMQALVRSGSRGPIVAGESPFASE
ncbi:MAG: DUF1570 domain-containing protein [Phycisphaerales bacterium]|nr:MAG: DUF1570 domain-containing protein [Phycisphaerales bacterium]